MQQVVGLVDGPGLGVLDGNDPELGLGARDPGEDEPYRVARKRLGIRDVAGLVRYALRAGLVSTAE